MWVLFFLIFECINIFCFEYWKAAFMLSSLKESQSWQSVCSVNLKRASLLFFVWNTKIILCIFITKYPLYFLIFLNQKAFTKHLFVHYKQWWGKCENPLKKCRTVKAIYFRQNKKVLKALINCTEANLANICKYECKRGRLSIKLYLYVMYTCMYTTW